MRQSLLAASAALLFTATAADAVLIYGINHLTGGPNSSDSLVVFDSGNPAGFTVIGSTGVNGVGFGGLAFDRSGGLWAYASYYSATGGAAAGLYRIDINTGVATAVGSSTRTLDDLAYNPVTDKMYGIRTQQGQGSRLYEVDLSTGATTLVGSLTGIDGVHALTGLAFDSAGNMYVNDVANGRIYGGSGLAMTALYDAPYVLAGSQGIDIDWSRDDTGYHAAVAQGIFPNYISQLNTFALDGSGYFLGDVFGPNTPDGLPALQLGDIAIAPIPAPGAAALFLAAAPLATRRRR